MNKTSNEPSCSVSEGGMAAEYLKEDKVDALVAPTTTDEYNTLRARINPVACWRVDDVRFDFDSSFVRPEVKFEMDYLKQLMHDHPGCPLSIFGHADPVGNDDYNKQLSGRRAMAIYGLLTRNTNLWEELYNEEWKKEHVLTVMFDEVAKAKKSEQPSSEPTFSDAAPMETTHAQLQSAGNSPSVAEYKNNSAKRKGLFLAYMNAICGPKFILDKNKNFLARGEDPRGKGDYQGCSEFNPLLLFSQTEEQEYAEAKDKTVRDEQNASNRRVIVLLFHEGSRVSPIKWPCPRAKEGVAGCRRRFWSDGEQRRSERLPDERRKYSETHDTFACRFYDRQIQVAEGSLCEKQANCIKIRFYDPGKEYIAEAPYEIMINGEKEPRKDKADDKGIASLYFVKVPTKCLAKWGFKTEDPNQTPELVFSLEMFLDIEEQGEEQKAPEEAGAEKEADNKDDREEEARKKLNNLGYTNSDLKENVADFQRDYSNLVMPPLNPTGILDDRTMKQLRRVYRNCWDQLDSPAQTAKPDELV